MALKRVVHDPVNDFASLNCGHPNHDPKARYAPILYLIDSEHLNSEGYCAECLAHDRGETLEEWAAHEEKCGSPSPYCLADAEHDLAEDLNIAELPSDLVKILKMYVRKP